MKMPTKIPTEMVELDDSDAEIEMPDQPMMPQRKEYLWGTDLTGKNAQIKFEGGDAEDETLVFKSAALGAGASGKHVVELSAVDVKSEKVTVTLCVLNDTNCYIRLPSISVEPPILLKLTEGEGPINICANHVVSEEWDDEDEDMMDEEDDDEAAEEVDDREDEEEIVEAEVKEEVKTEVKAVATSGVKRKAEESPQKTEVKKVKPEKPKKAPKTYATIEELQKAITANPGGKPKKEEKFKNWVKNTMKSTNEDWLPDLWTWHQEQTKVAEAK